MFFYWYRPFIVAQTPTVSGYGLLLMGAGT